MPTGGIKVKLTIDAEEYNNLLQNFKDLFDVIANEADNQMTRCHPWDLEGCEIDYIYETAYDAGRSDFARALAGKIKALPSKESND